MRSEVRAEAHRAERLRSASGPIVAEALVASRSATLASFECYERQLRELGVPQHPHLNPPLWELGHIGWFQEYWTSRNPQWRRGHEADPACTRGAGVLAGADRLYDSSQVPHPTRWSLALPAPEQTRAVLAEQLQATLRLLESADDSDASLYFFRLALLHEDMHHEATTYMAQALDLQVDADAVAPRSSRDNGGDLHLNAARSRIGAGEDGFAFDNELRSHDVDVATFAIDAAAVRWREYLPFVEEGGYEEPRYWSAAGWQWLRQQALQAPRYMRRGDGAWEERRFGRWHRLDPGLPACHLSCHEAEAWCAWAGRRLPTEAEWERAAREAGAAFHWGEVWEWTASDFAPYPGFVAHPYRDYSEPWFGSRRVLRGASLATSARLRAVSYRNFFTPERNDIHAGFRSCPRSTSRGTT